MLDLWGGLLDGGEAWGRALIVNIDRVIHGRRSLCGMQLGRTLIRIGNRRLMRELGNCFRVGLTGAKTQVSVCNPRFPTLETNRGILLLLLLLLRVGE